MSVLTFFQPQAVFHNLSVRFALLSTKGQRVPSQLVKRWGLRRKRNPCFERFPAARPEPRELFPLHLLLLSQGFSLQFLTLIFSGFGFFF